MLARHLLYAYKGLILLFWMLFSLDIYAQDALNTAAQAYQKAPANTGERFLAAGPYARTLFFNNRQDEATELLRENIRSARTWKDGKYAAYLYGAAALQTYIQDDQPLTRLYLDSAKYFATHTRDPVYKGYVQYCQGWLYAREIQDVDAVEAFVGALQTLENTQAYTYQAAVCSELYAIYANWKSGDLQKKYAQLSLDLAQKINTPISYFDAYMRLGHLYESLHTREVNPALLDSAANYYMQALQLFKTHAAEMKAIPSNQAHAAINLANIYLAKGDSSDYRQAAYYAKLALDIANTYDHAQFKAYSYGILSTVSRHDQDIEAAKAYLLSALEIATQGGTMPIDALPEIYKNLAEIYQIQGDEEKSLYYYQQYIEVREKIFNSDKLELASRLEAQYQQAKQQRDLTQLQLEGERKERQIVQMNAEASEREQALKMMRLNQENQYQQLALAKSENARKNQEIEAIQREISLKSRINKIYIILFSLALILVGLLFYAYRQRSRTLRHREHLHTLEMQQIRQKSEISNLTAMLDGQEQERSRIARDLHDGLGGLLSGTKIELSGLRSGLQDPSTKGKLTRSLNQLDDAVDELRRVAHNLMPELLLKYGLKEAIKEYCIRMSSSQLEVSSEILLDVDQLDTTRQIMVYRIIQELVNNAMKHAQSNHILIQLAENEDRINLTVEDDGLGFDITDLDMRKSAGIHTVRSRLDYLKGQLQMHSEPGMGTTIEVEFPARANMVMTEPG